MRPKRSAVEEFEELAEAFRTLGHVLLDAVEHDWPRLLAVAVLAYAVLLAVVFLARP